MAERPSQVVPNNGKGKNMAKRFERGDEVVYRGERYIVCEGGQSDGQGHYLYKIMRGSRKLYIRGDLLSSW